jgi:biotin carboxylase
MVENCLIILGAGTAQMPLIKKAEEMGYVVIAVDRNPKALGLELVSEKIIISTYETELVIEALKELNKKYVYKGIVARASGPALKTAAAIADYFNLPGLRKEIVPLSTEKSKLRECCKINNLPFPKGMKIKPDNFSLDMFDVPVIVKPDLPIIGKKEVKLIQHNKDINMAIENAGRVSYNRLVEVEEFIEGFDIGCLFRVNDNQASLITFWDEMVGIEKDGSIIGCGVSIPSIIQNTEIESRVENIVQKFSTIISPHIDALLILAFRIDTNGDPYVIELHADLGGDLIADNLFPVSDHDFDYFKLCIQIATKSLNDISIPKFSPSAIIYKGLFDEQIPSERTTELVQSSNIQDLLVKIREHLIIDKNKYLIMPINFDMASQFYN